MIKNIAFNLCQELQTSQTRQLKNIPCQTKLRQNNSKSIPCQTIPCRTKLRQSNSQSIPCRTSMPNETETKQLTKQIRMLPSPACAWPLCLGATRGKQGQQCCDARVRTSRIDAHIYTLVAPHRVEQAYQNTPSHTRHHHGPGCALPGCHSHGVTMCGVHSSCTCRENVTSNKSRQQHNSGPHQMCFGFLFFP